MIHRSNDNEEMEAQITLKRLRTPSPPSPNRDIETSNKFEALADEEDTASSATPRLDILKNSGAKPKLPNEGKHKSGYSKPVLSRLPPAHRKYNSPYRNYESKVKPNKKSI